MFRGLKRDNTYGGELKFLFYKAKGGSIRSRSNLLADSGPLGGDLPLVWVKLREGVRVLRLRALAVARGQFFHVLRLLSRPLRTFKQ